MLGLFLWPRVSQALTWRAIITPLASIIGSGFLVLGPILGSSYGSYAPIAMLLLCAVAYGFGNAIRFNIQFIDAQVDRKPREHALETFASWVLAFAYVISVAYYLNLFGAFGVSLTSFDNSFYAKLLTSTVLVLILFVGWTKGFSAMERMEQISVSLKLAIIVGLLLGLGVHFSDQVSAGDLRFDQPVITGWAALTLGFGLIVTVQGFETSRYLGAVYEAPLRIRSMKLAQYISTIIYLTYIVLLTYAFDTRELGLDETAIIDMMAIVAPVLPLLLVAAALSAQFSAAVADTHGAGGLLTELSDGRISPRTAYAILVTAGLIITWAVNLFEIIAYASRAFALYYAAQALIAAFNAKHSGYSALRISFFAGLAALGLCMAIFGDSVA
ncbi:MAG: hypothetical protein ACI9XK_004638 [Granulosicoccus sp.]|jgi:hypothetical protein